MAENTAEPTVPESWESATGGGSEAKDLAARCMGMPEAELRRLMDNAGTHSTISQKPADKTKPYLIIRGSKIICVQRSNKGFPMLPHEAFHRTIHFESMNPEMSQALRIHLSNQIANRGTAAALIKNDLGNAVYITYLLPEDSAVRMFYQAVFLRPGDFDENKFEKVFSSSSKMTMTSRGTPSERVKYFILD